MTVDYDGVIISGTIQGREAAALAAREGARVALVEAPGEVERLIWRQLTIQVCAQLGQQSAITAGWDGSPPFAQEDWPGLRQRVAACAAVAYPHLTLAGLATGGVDVVTEAGQFSLRPKLAFTTANRRLRGRGFVLCPGPGVRVPAIPELAQTPYLTVDTLLNLVAQPQNLIVLGRSGDAIALALALARLGTRITLVSRGQTLLPTEDSDIAAFIAALLLAAGVDLHLGAELETIYYQGQFKIQLTNGQLLQAENLLLATAPRPQIADLNLACLGLDPTALRLSVDDRLATAHPRVFACGPSLGGYWAETTDHRDVPIAVRNALYLPRRRLGTLNRLGVLYTAPEFARLGLTATQAQRWYGDQAQVLQISYGECLKSHLVGDITGFCRWVVHRDGRLLGAQICGPEARDLIQTVALLVEQNIRIQQMEHQPVLPHSFTEMLARMVDLWQRSRWQPGTGRRDWAENWFNWRRSRG
ncbi:MAG: FAD-dependent oxidoreductase [Nodosilinea sp.]